MSEKKPKKKVSIIRVLIVAIILIGFIGAGAVFGIVMSVIKTTDPIDASNIYDLLDESSFILDSEGELLEKIESSNFRVVIDYSEMPKHLKDAFVSIEDERFWTHRGVDPKRIVGALWTNFRTGSKQGASTINQQLAVNLYLKRSDRSYSRKIKDAYYGIMLNNQLSKDQILEAYLNTIYLGSGAHGVQAASQQYFSKDAKDLTIAESALIAGITRHPARNTPIITLEKQDVKEHHVILDDSDLEYTVVMNENIDKYVISRQKLVLSAMKRLGSISESEYNEALNEDIKSALKPNRTRAENISSYFADLVKRDVISSLEETGYTKDEATNLLYSGGLTIISTLDTKIQKILDEEYSISSNFPKINNSDKGKLLANKGFTEDENGNLRDEEGQIQPQSAMVISDPQTGAIKAIVGGRMGSGKQILNRALSPRQPGSAIKPIAAYAPAIDKGFTAASIIDDVPAYFNKGTPGTPWPRNPYLSSGFRGLITIRESLERSSNVGAVKMANMLSGDTDSSINTMLDYMRRMGITTVYDRNNAVTIKGQKYSDETLSTALGGMTRGVSPVEMNGAFGVLANGGTYIKPTTFIEIWDKDENLVLENNLEEDRILTPQAAYIMTDMLKGVISSPRGTGGRAKIGSMPAAGKTGTTSDQKDAWFVGYTPYYTASVWIGSDQPVRLTSGSASAATLWSKIMTRVHEGHDVIDFPMPENIIRTNVCTISGQRPSSLCSSDSRGGTVKSEIFIKGTEPSEVCEAHVMVNIHAPSGKLATEETPPWETEERLFVKRPIPYYPDENGGITPLDYPYDLPKEYYDPVEDVTDNPFQDGSPDGNEIDGEPTDEDDEEIEDVNDIDEVEEKEKDNLIDKFLDKIIGLK